MIDQWNELKETIAEMRDNDGTASQQDTCKFLVNYMDTLEKQMLEYVAIDKVMEIIDEETQASNDTITHRGYAETIHAIRRRLLALKGGE